MNIQEWMESAEFKQALVSEIAAGILKHGLSQAMVLDDSAPKPRKTRQAVAKRRAVRRPQSSDERLTVKSAILDVIRHGPKTNEEVVAGVLKLKPDSTEASILHTLYALSGDRAINKSDDLKWRIVPKPPKP
jgi:hypothetical protein